MKTAFSRWLEANGLSVYQFARDAGLSIHQVYRLAGTRQYGDTISLSAIDAVAELTGLPPHKLAAEAIRARGERQ
jgi:hypothetical protein